MKKVAVNIGINNVDNSSYGIDIPELLVAENDAIEFNKICNDYDFQSQLILSSEATTSNILATLKSASKTLTNGDIFLLTYSGHGCKFPDLNGDEEDGLDEAWVCYDKILLDDEIKLSLSQFSEGVKCFIILDCCYSNGTTDAKKS